MNKRVLLPASAVALILLILNFQLVLAHTTVTAGDYRIEIGWVNEPPLVGQQNAIVVNITNTSGGNQQPVDDVSNLVVSVAYGGQNKTLTLQPLSEDTHGQFVAPILPTIPGQYTVNVSGKLGTTDVNVAVQPEEVDAADTLQFPKVAASQQSTGFGLTGWLALLGLVSGLAGVGIGIAALRKTR